MRARGLHAPVGRVPRPGVADLFDFGVLSCHDGRTGRLVYDQQRIRDGFTPPAVLDGAYLRRWNVLAGLVADGFIQGPLARSGRTLLWMEKRKTPVLVDASQGGGRVLVSKLAFRGRLDPAGGNYDPVAGRLLLYLLSR